MNRLLETCHSFTLPMMIYQNTVTNWQDPEANSYPLATNVATEILITALVQVRANYSLQRSCFDLFTNCSTHNQSYFIYRIYRLSSHCILISFVSLVFVCLRFLGGAILAVETYLDVPNRPNGISLVVRFMWLITSTLAISGAADAFIAMCMTFYLVQLSSPANKES